MYHVSNDHQEFISSKFIMLTLICIEDKRGEFEGVLLVVLLFISVLSAAVLMNINVFDK